VKEMRELQKSCATIFRAAHRNLCRALLFEGT